MIHWVSWIVLPQLKMVWKIHNENAKLEVGSDKPEGGSDGWSLVDAVIIVYANSGRFKEGWFSLRLGRFPPYTIVGEASDWCTNRKGEFSLVCNKI